MESEPCSICLNDVINPAKPQGCCHIFCRWCLEKWSEQKDYCPMCRQPFSFYECGWHKQSGEYEMLKRVENERVRAERRWQRVVRLMTQERNPEGINFSSDFDVPSQQTGFEVRTRRITQPPTIWETESQIGPERTHEGSSHQHHVQRQVQNDPNESDPYRQVQITVELG